MTKCVEQADQWGISEPTLPRIRRAPRRLDDKANAASFDDPSEGLLQEELLRVSGLCCSCDQLKIQHSLVGSSLHSRTTSDGRSCSFETGYRTLRRRHEPWKTGTSAALSQWHARNWEASSDSVIWLTCYLELTLQDIWKKWKHWWNCCLFYSLRHAVLRDHALLFVGWRLTLVNYVCIEIEPCNCSPQSQDATGELNINSIVNAFASANDARKDTFG